MGLKGKEDFVKQNAINCYFVTTLFLYLNICFYLVLNGIEMYFNL